MSDFVIVRNAEGKERRWSRNTYRLLPKRLKAEWQIVGEAKGPLAPAQSASGAKAATFLPPELIEAERAMAESERVAQSAMISGAAQEQPKEAAPAPLASAASAKAAEPVKEPVNDPAKQPEKKASEKPAKADDLSALPNMGAKCAEALAAAGIDSFAKLIETPTPDINRVLEAANFLPKKAQVPGWKLKAAELAAK